eukprot:1454296-Rhodomonas_salina.3
MDTCGAWSSRRSRTTTTIARSAKFSGSESGPSIDDRDGHVTRSVTLACWCDSDWPRTRIIVSAWRSEDDDACEPLCRSCRSPPMTEACLEG